MITMIAGLAGRVLRYRVAMISEDRRTFLPFLDHYFQLGLAEDH